MVENISVFVRPVDVDVKVLLVDVFMHPQYVAKPVSDIIALICTVGNDLVPQHVIEISCSS